MTSLQRKIPAQPGGLLIQPPSHPYSPLLTPSIPGPPPSEGAMGESSPPPSMPPPLFLSDQDILDLDEAFQRRRAPYKPLERLAAAAGRAVADEFALSPSPLPEDRWSTSGSEDEGVDDDWDISGGLARRNTTALAHFTVKKKERIAGLPRKTPDAQPETTGLEMLEQRRIRRARAISDWKATLDESTARHESDGKKEQE
ncbi:hypothetical protein FRC00_010028 [Tulasnella sp. 408]|nr:hypothetical protein FRC00_010028 [Tulasnella sp. 408]